MLRTAVKRSFGFLKSLNQRSSKQINENFVHQYFRNAKFLSSQKDAIPIDLSKLKLEYMPDTAQLSTNVPKLQHGLDKFLNGELVFGDQGVGNLPQQNQKTDNQKIQKISGYITPQNDTVLLEKSLQTNCKYISSTSSISSPLIALLPITDNILQGMPSKSLNWMVSYRKPTIFYLHPLKDGRFAISSDKGVLPVANKVLMDLGHVVQYFLTHTRQQTDKLMRGQTIKQVNNYYRYARVNQQIMLRSQIDCMSYDAQGKPYVFQIKSRACAPIRYDVQNYKQYTDYQINSKRGLYQSFQRQYYDLIRGGFLKYVMQVKIGRMDGAFVAYHNTQKIYGYEYIKMKQMALRVFGDQFNLDVSFVCISKMLTLVLDHIRNSLPQHKQDSLKIGFYAEYKAKKLVVMVQGMSNVKQYIPLTQKPQNIQTIFDYFKVNPLQNPIYKFQFDFFFYINGIKLDNPQVLLTPHDTLEIKYKATNTRNISQNQYMFFLYQAYKQKQLFGSIMYRGSWSFADLQAQ